MGSMIEDVRSSTWAVLRAADFAASCLRGALPVECVGMMKAATVIRDYLPPVDLRAVCLVRAICDCRVKIQELMS